MDHNPCDQKSNSITNLKKMPQEELESRIDFLLAKCRAEVEIKKTIEQGAMFSSGPFQISISLAVKIRKYQDDLLYCRRNPYDVLKSVCMDNGWDAPEFRAVDYMPVEGFLFSVIVNEHELVSKWRNRRPLLAADLASANFLRYLGLWVNVKNLNMYFEWEPINSECTEGQTKGIGDLNGYLYFMGFNLIKTETIGDEQNALKTSVLSLRPNIHSEWAKLIYVFLTSRGEKSCWLTDIDLAFFKQIFGDLEPLESHGYNCLSWTHHGPGMICNCEKRLSKICFDHDGHFFLLLLKDYYYVEKYAPVNIKVFRQLKKIKKEKKYTPVVKNYIEKTLQDSKTFIREMGLEILEEVKKEETDMAKNGTKKRSKEVETSNCVGTSTFKGSLFHEKCFERSKDVKKEADTTKNETKKRSKEVDTSSCGETFTFKGSLIHEKGFERSKEVKKEEANMGKNETKKTSKQVETSNCRETSTYKGSHIHEKGFERSKEVKKEQGKECTMIKHETKKRSKESHYEKTFIFNDPYPTSVRLTSTIEFDPTETPMKLVEKKHNLMSKLFGRIKVEDLIKTEREDFKISFDNTTGLSNVKSSVGSCISLVDISPPRVSLANSSSKRPRPRSISVLTSERRMKRKK